MTVRLLVGDCRAMLATLPDASVHACITSPPYFALRRYLDPKGYEWANQTGAYNDPYDFKRMCTSCHRTLDAARRRETGERTSPRRGGDAKCPQTD